MRAGARHPSCCRADVVSILPPAPEEPTFQTNGVAGQGSGRERVGQGPGRDRVGRRWCGRASRCWGRASWRPGRASRRCGGDRGTGGKHWCGRGRSGLGGVALASTACTPGHGGSRRRECGRASGRDGRTGGRASVAGAVPSLALGAVCAVMSTPSAVSKRGLFFPMAMSSSRWV